MAPGRYAGVRAAHSGEYNVPRPGSWCILVWPSPRRVSQLGLVGQHLWVRPEPDGHTRRNQRRQRPVEDKESHPSQLQQDVLVRAAWNRRVQNQDGYLWETSEQAPVAGRLTIEVPRADNRPSRRAELEHHIAKVTLRAPYRRRADGLLPIALNTVLARETNPPDGQEPIEWVLLTTCTVVTEADAAACLRCTHRWTLYGGSLTGRNIRPIPHPT